jgi:hypothetical protein
MRKIGQRSLAPRETTGPRVGAVVTRDGVTIRVLNTGERPTLPAATVLADDASAEAVRRAALVVADRIKAHARQPIPLTVTIA